MESTPARRSREIDNEPETDRDNKHLINESPDETPLCCCQSSAVNLTIPKDRFFLAYFAMFLVGMGVLFPWNSFVSALDYFMFFYRPYRPEVAIPITYLVVTLVSMGFTTAAVNVFPLHGRIGFGYVMFTVVLVFLPLFDLVINKCLVSMLAGFLLTLGSVMLVGLGSGVQQSSLYGLAGVLPGPWYTQAIMVGESAAGITVAIIRVITKAAATEERTEDIVTKERTGAIAFFITSLVFILMCVGCQVFLRLSPFVNYHLKKFQADQRAAAEKANEALYSRQPDNERKGLLQNETHTDVFPNFYSRKEQFISGVKLRVKLIMKQWRLLLTVFLVFNVTLMVFPGITSEVQYCAISDWTPVIMVLAFNFTDFISRWVALLYTRWNHTLLLIISVGRYLLIPLLVLCVSPSPSQPLLPFPLIWTLVLILIVGFTNGYFGTLPMVLAPKRVENEHREIVGTISALFLLAGLAAGSGLAYALMPLTTLDSTTYCVNSTLASACNFTNSTNVTSIFLS